MPKSIYKILLFFSLLSFDVSLSSYSQDISKQTARIMFYNVENLFDVFDDTLTDDDAFLPKGVMRWNSIRYNRKINSLYKVIIAAGEWDPPAIVALAEIENRKVLNDLIYGTYLSGFNFKIIHEDSPDKRGIDVCIIYRQENAELITYKYLIPYECGNSDFNTRSVLYSKFIICNDTVHIFVNHWPSKRGGVLAGDDRRNMIAAMLRKEIDSLFKNRTSVPKIIVLGDFNCSPEDKVIKSLCLSYNKATTLINLTDCIEEKSSGTYRFMGMWESIDQIVVSSALLSNSRGLYTKPDLIKVFRQDFLLKKDHYYPGNSPYSTYKGYKYQGGYSDHLPIFLDLRSK